MHHASHNHELVMLESKLRLHSQQSKRFAGLGQCACGQRFFTLSSTNFDAQEGVKLFHAYHLEALHAPDRSHIDEP